MKNFSFFALVTLMVILSIGCVRSVGTSRIEGTPTIISPTITEEEARTVLAQVVELANKRDKKALCAIAGFPTDCERDFDLLGGADGVPTEPPTVVEVRKIDGIMMGEVGSPAGYLLVLEGKSGLGKQYKSDFFVADNGNNPPQPFTSIYWGGMQYTGGNPIGATATKLP